MEVPLRARRFKRGKFAQAREVPLERCGLHKHFREEVSELTAGSGHKESARVTAAPFEQYRIAD
jgi:hypothetical protein